MKTLMWVVLAALVALAAYFGYRKTWPVNNREVSASERAAPLNVRTNKESAVMKTPANPAADVQRTLDTVEEINRINRMNQDLKRNTPPAPKQDRQP